MRWITIIIKCDVCRYPNPDNRDTCFNCDALILLPVVDEVVPSKGKSLGDIMPTFRDLWNDLRLSFLKIASIVIIYIGINTLFQADNIAPYNLDKKDRIMLHIDSLICNHDISLAGSRRRMVFEVNMDIGTCEDGISRKIFSILRNTSDRTFEFLLAPFNGMDNAVKVCVLENVVDSYIEENLYI